LHESVAVVVAPRVTLAGTEQLIPVGSGVTDVERVTVPENPFKLAKESDAVVVDPTSAVIEVGLTVAEKSKNDTVTWWVG
jgi:hypothetical protein